MSIDTGNGGAATGCPCGCGAAEKAHCWRESDWEANGRADEIVSALAAAVEGRRGDALRIAHAIGDKTVEAAVGMILRVPGMEQTSREAHQAIAREKARTMIARDGAEVLRGEIERLRAMFVQPAVVTEDVDHLGTQWGVSFDGLDPAPEHHVRVASREDAFRLKALVDRMRAEIAIREDGVQQAKGDVGALRDEVAQLQRRLALKDAAIERLRGVPRPEDLPDDPDALKSIIRGLDVEIYGAMADLAAMKRATAG